MKLLDETGKDVAERKMSPTVSAVVEMSDALKLGRVMSIQKIAEKLGKNEGYIKDVLLSAPLVGRTVKVGGKRYLCSPATYKEYYAKKKEE